MPNREKIFGGFMGNSAKEGPLGAKKDTLKRVPDKELDSNRYFNGESPKKQTFVSKLNTQEKAQ